MTQNQALEILKTGVNVFLTGEPGSGKTHTVNRYVSYLRSHEIEPAITASTGIAATHIGGMTIHSWSGLGIKDRLTGQDLRNIAGKDHVKRRVRRAKVLIIDEISMLPPHTLQNIDAICRKLRDNPLPFGGVQIVLVGDFFQLPPVVKRAFNDDSQENFLDEFSSRFAYDASIFKQAEFVTCYITEQYRQDDQTLLSILSKIRTNKFDALSLEIIKQRKIGQQNVPPNVPKLYSHNIDVDSTNDQMLGLISGETKEFLMQAVGHEALIKAMKKGCLSPEKLCLKIGAAVMFTKNNPKEGFVNGSLGEVTGFDRETGLPIVKVRNGRKIEVAPAEWSVEENGKIKGRLSQIPLRLAWAITVHKSQGTSLDEAVIDLSKVFEFGQGYVALSRVRRLSGIHILGLNEIAFQVDQEVLKKDADFRLQSEQAEKMYAGLPPAELEKIQKNFIIFCDGRVDATGNSAMKNEKISTYDLTLQLWRQGEKIAQIAKIRNLTEGTILSHVEWLVKKEKIKKTELAGIVTPRIRRDLSRINAAFEKFGAEKLSPVFEYFGGEFSYDTLKIARMVIE